MPTNVSLNDSSDTGICVGGDSMLTPTQHHWHIKWANTQNTNGGWLPFFICLRTVLELFEKSNIGETVGLSDAKE